LREQVVYRLASDPPLLSVLAAAHTPAHIQENRDPAGSKTVLGTKNRGWLLIDLDKEIVFRQISNRVSGAIKNID